MAKAKEVSIIVIEKARKTLDKMPTKKPETKLIADALTDLKPTIEAAIEKGYSRIEVVELLKNNGVDVREYHIKELLKKKREEK